jgi:uncharacterized membrane protein YfcA
VNVGVALLVVAVGFASGVLSGMFGVGGAVLTTPGVRALGATPIEAVGSTLPAILPGALSGAWRYSRAGMVDWHVAIPSGLLGCGFAVVGAELSDHINGHYLMLMTAAMLLWTGVANIRKHRVHAKSLLVPAAVGAAPSGADVAGDAPGAESESTSTTGVAFVGAAAGLLAGLLGIGGGVLLVPAYTALLRIPPKRAVATSLVAVAMFSIPAMITHAWLGHINWAFASLLVVGVVPGAQLGAHVTLGGSEVRLRFLMGLFFTILACAYGFGEILSL